MVMRMPWNSSGAMIHARQQIHQHHQHRAEHRAGGQNQPVIRAHDVAHDVRHHEPT